MASTLLLPRRHYLNDGYGIRSWLLTRDHKRIALLYLAAVTVFFFVGGAFAVLIRLELATPAGDLVTEEQLLALIEYVKSLTAQPLAAGSK